MSQLIALFNHAQLVKKGDYVFDAAVHGIDLENAGKKNKKQQKSQLPMFDDPKNYENYTPDQRKAMTERMMSVHKGWAGKAMRGHGNG